MYIILLTFLPIHRDEATQIASLKIVQGMLNELDIKDIAQLLPYLTAFSSHSSVQCRITMYNVLMAIYNRLRLVCLATCIIIMT